MRWRNVGRTVVGSCAVLAAGSAWAAQAEAAGEGLAGNSSQVVALAAAAAFTMGISVLGSGYAVGRIGSAALGAAAEKPELLTRSILFVALAEGLAVLGFAIAMMLVQKI